MQCNYNMSNQQLPTADRQQDLGVISTKTSSDKNKQRTTAKRPTEYSGSLPAISGTQRQRTDPSLIQIPTRPHLEHAVQFWSPQLRRDIGKIEKV